MCLIQPQAVIAKLKFKMKKKITRVINTKPVALTFPLKLQCNDLFKRPSFGLLEFLNPL